MTVDYGAWTANAKAQAVEDRLNILAAAESPTSYFIVYTWANGWGVYSSRSVGIRLIEQGRAARVTGQFSGGTTTDATAVFYLNDSSYWPGRVEAVPIGATGATVGAGSPYLEFRADGWVLMYGGGNYHPDHFTISGTYPLDTS